MKRTTVHLTETQRNELKQMSEETGLLQAEIIRRAIDEHLARWKEKREKDKQ